jgi:multisubunit Na+/H+ antiporter MnhC subunit
MSNVRPHTPQMPPWIAIWLALAAVHVALMGAGWVAGSDWLAPIIVGSIYLPLWPLGKLGLPVVRLSGSIFPPPTAIGWTAIVICWSLVCWLIAVVIAWRLSTRNRAA